MTKLTNVKTTQSLQLQKRTTRAGTRLQTECPAYVARNTLGTTYVTTRVHRKSEVRYVSPFCFSHAIVINPVACALLRGTTRRKPATSGGIGFVTGSPEVCRLFPAYGQSNHVCLLGCSWLGLTTGPSRNESREANAPLSNRWFWVQRPPEGSLHLRWASS